MPGQHPSVAVEDGSSYQCSTRDKALFANAKDAVSSYKRDFPVWDIDICGSVLLEQNSIPFGNLHFCLGTNFEDFTQVRLFRAFRCLA